MPFVKKPLRTIGVIAIAGGLVSAAWHYSHPKPLMVDLAVITIGNVEATVVNTRAGTIKSCQRSNLAPITGGQIAKIWVKEGDHVQKDQVLLELWNQDLQAQRELAQRQLTMAQERRRETCILAENARRNRTVRSNWLSKASSARNAPTTPMRTPVRARPVAKRPFPTSNALKRKFTYRKPELIAPSLSRHFPASSVNFRRVGEFTTPSPPHSDSPTIDLIDDRCLTSPRRWTGGCT